MFRLSYLRLMCKGEGEKYSFFLLWFELPAVGKNIPPNNLKNKPSVPICIVFMVEILDLLIS